MRSQKQEKPSLQPVTGAPDVLAQFDARMAAGVARYLNIDKSSVSRRCQAAMRAGYNLNSKDKEAHRCIFELAEPMPVDAEVLPEHVARATSVQPNSSNNPPEKVAESPTISGLN